MSGSVIAPPMFLQHPGQPVLLWEDWKDAFEAYLEAIGGDIFVPKHKLALIKHNLGVEWRNILRSLPSPDTQDDEDKEEDNVYEKAIKVLSEHHSKKLNVVVDRHKLFSRSRQLGENI